MAGIQTGTDVLIVGAGPVGLFLANECARRGLAWRLVEERSGQSEHSKALAIFPRTLEIFDMAGVVDPFLQLANRVTWVSIIAPSRSLGRIHFAPDNTPYSYVAMVPQDVTEKILVNELQRKGGGVDYNTKFISAVEQDGCVKATLERNGAEINLTAKYLVGCDGAHSAVRHLLDLPFEGEQYHDSFMLADVETNEALPADEMQLCPSEFGPLAIFPMSATRRRIVATIDATEGDAPSLELVRRIAAQRAPAALDIRSIRWSSYFRIHHRQVSKLRVGRTFVAGDAAHIHSPFGGQGMNTGLQDAWNLVWKLSLAARGWGNDLLLESYTTERRPVIKDVLQTTDRLTRGLGTSKELAQMMRNIAIPVLTHLPPFIHTFVQKLSQLSIAYAGSPGVEGDGARYFDDSLRGGSGIRDRFILLVPSDLDSASATMIEHLQTSYNDVLETRPGKNAKLTLLRPDGYIACEGAGGVSTVNRILLVLERQIINRSRESMIGVA